MCLRGIHKLDMCKAPEMPGHKGRAEMGETMKAEKGLFPKVKALYEAVEELIFENVDVKEIKVSDITSRAGIGKGTAYEYFKNKEEIISSALLYHIDLICRQMIKNLKELNDFTQAMEFILSSIDREIKKRDCLIQFVHLLSDNGLIGKVLQKKMKEKNKEICTPRDVLSHMIQVGMDNGDISREIPAAYASMAIAAKVIAYIIYIPENGEEEFSRGEMHRMICAGLRRELQSG